MTTTDTATGSVSAVQQGKKTGKQAIRTKRLLALFVLIVQSSSLVLLMRYTRTIVSPAALYLPSTAVFLTELVKIATCLLVVAVLHRRRGSAGTWYGTLWPQLTTSGGWRLIVPAALYALQNNMLYVALTNLDAATYQVTYQLKVLTTALFSVGMLNRRLSAIQWLCLFMLMLGVALVQLDQTWQHSALQERLEQSQNLLEQVDEEDMLNLAYSSDVVLLLDDTAQDVADTVVSGVIEQNNLLGLTAVFFSCLTSGFAGVYFERVLKGSQTSLWVRNIQLGVFGAICSFVLMVLNDYSLIAEQGLLYGYNGYVYTVILNQALGGLVVALVVRYSDQILKGFALSVAVVLSCFVSIFMFDFKPTVMFALGALMVVASVFLYSFWGGKGEKQSNKSSILPVSHKEDD